MQPCVYIKTSIPATYFPREIERSLKAYGSCSGPADLEDEGSAASIAMAHAWRYVEPNLSFKERHTRRIGQDREVVDRPKASKS